MQTILVPLDGSALAEQVLPLVRLLAPAMRAHVVLLRVFTDSEHEYTVTRPPAPAPAGSRAARWAHEQHQRWLQQRHAIERELETPAAPLRAAGIDVALDIEPGLPGETILRVAERQQATLIALASHAYRGLRRWAAGSVAEQVIQRSAVPTLLVRAGVPAPAERIGRILAPLDGSVHARHVLAHALALAHCTAAELVVLQTIAPSIEDLIGTSATPSVQRETLHAHVLEAYANHFGAASAAQAHITAVIGLGDPAHAIAEEAARAHTGLVVVANRAHGAAALAPIARSVAAPLLVVPTLA